MGRDLAGKFPVARRTFEEADEALGFSISKLCFEGPEDQLKLTEFQQPAICTVSVAALRVLAEKEITPAFVAGHSLGEYAANVAAGSIAFADAVRTVRQRGRFMQEAVPAGQGAMAAVLGLSSEDTAKACEDAAARPTRSSPLPISIRLSRPSSPAKRPPSNVPLKSAKNAEPGASLCFRSARLSTARSCSPPRIASPNCSVPSPFQRRMFPSRSMSTRRSLPTPISSAKPSSARSPAAVRWVDSIRLLIAQQPTHFIEAGPGTVLCGLMRQIDRTQPCHNVEDSASLEKTLLTL